MTAISAKCFLTLLVSLCVGAACSLVFQSTTCSSTESLIVRLYGVSFSTCAEECEKRENCSLYNYRTGFHSCELLSKNGNETAVTKGCVVGIKPTTSVRKCKCSPEKGCVAAGGPGPKKECPPLSVPRATVFGNVWTVGSKAAIICDSDKTYYTTECQEGGTWKDLPTCSVCGAAPKVANAVPSGTGHGELGSVLTFACNDGYSVPDDNNNFNVTCLDNGDWSDVGFQCKRNCSDPIDIGNATLQTGDTIEGAERNYICFTHFITRTGSNVISVTCTSSGQWTSPNETCVRSCGEPSIAHANVSPGTVHEGSIRTYHCDEKYHVMKNGNITMETTDNMTCTANGVWEWMAECVSETCSLKTIGNKTLMICKEKLTHARATEECKRFGELVRIDTPFSYLDILSVLHSTENEFSGHRYRVQGKYNATDGTFKFNDGTPMGVGISNHIWRDTDANDMECVHLGKRPYMYVMRIGRCHAPIGYICTVN